jgi:hypothetical protein
MKNQQQLLDLNEYTNYLSPYKRRRGEYHCPVCQGKLSISRGNGSKFTCWAGCDRRDIRRAILELTGETQTHSQEWAERAAAKQERLEEAERERIAALRPEIELDRDWRKIIDGLFLSDRHRQDMLDRGWTPEQIELSNARSSAKGRIIPITTAVGLVVGSQVITSEGKPWYAVSPQLRETGELPLTIVHPQAPRTGTIALTESTLDKPHLTAHRFNLVTIGSSNIGSQPKDLARTIAAIKERYGWDEIELVMMADGGAVANKHVLNNYGKLTEQLPDLKFGWWGQIAKGGTDIDEIDPATKIEYISPKKFFEIAEKQGTKAKDRELWDKLSKLSYQVTDKRDETYLAPIPLPRAGSLSFVSSSCGTGKTHQLPSLIDNWLRAHPQGRIIDITHRNSIKDSHQRRLGIGEYKVGHGQNQAALNSNQKISICLDSLLQLNLDDIPPGSLLIADELEAILDHLARGGTLGNNTAKVQAHLTDLIDRIVSTGGAVIGLEDNLTDLAIDGLLDLTHRKYPHELIVNTHQRFNWDVTIGNSSLANYLALIFARLERGEKIAIPTTSQRFGETLERLVMEQLPHLRIKRIDAKTAPDSHDFLADPNAWLEANEIDLLIYSPTIESGIDINGGYFDRRMAYFVNLNTRAQIQLLYRERSNIPTDIFIPERGAQANTIGRDPHKILKCRRNIANKTALAQGFGKIPMSDAGKVWNELEAKFTARDALSARHAAEYLTLDLKGRGHQVERVDDWADILDELGQDGRERPDSKQLKQRFSAIKLEIEVEENAILDRADGKAISPETAVAMLHSSGITFEKKQQARKCLLHRDLPGAELTEEFLMAAVTKNRGKYLRQCELTWLLDKPALAHHLDREAFTQQITSPHIIYSRAPKRQQQVDLFAPIRHDLDYLASGGEYRDGDDIVDRIYQWGLDNSYLIWSLLSLNIRETTLDIDNKRQNSPIAAVNKILKRLGYHTTSRKEGARKCQVLVYRVDNADCPYRQTIYQALERKHREYLAAHPSEVSTLSNTEFSILENVDTDPSPMLIPPDIAIGKQIFVGGEMVRIEKIEGKLIYGWSDTGAYLCIPSDLVS